MGYIYAFRLGGNDLFKIGQTTMTPTKRRSSLQTGCPYPLTLVDDIETDEHKALEKYIKTTWGDRRGHEGGTEIYRFTEAELADVFDRCRTWLTEELPKARQVQQFEAVEPEPTVLPADDIAVALRGSWLELDGEEQRLRAELNRVATDKTRVETELKLAIGCASAIAGIATWELGSGRRLVNPDKVKSTDPALYEQCLEPKFDATKLKAALQATGQYTYEQFQDLTRTREFKITE